MIMPSITRCGRLRQDEAVFDGARLAFVGVADDVFFRTAAACGRAAISIRWETRAAQAAEAGGFQLLEGGIPVARLHEAADDGVTIGRRGVWIGGAGNAATRWRGFGLRSLRDDVANHFLDLRFGEARVDAVVYGDGGSLIAAAEAGNAADGDFRGAEILKAFFQARAQIVAAAKVARHVLANADVRLRWRREAKVRIKAGDSVQAIQGNVNLFRQILQFFSRQVTEPVLDLPQPVEDQRESPRTEGRSFLRRNQSRL